jgi:hypothetical protein
MHIFDSYAPTFAPAGIVPPGTPMLSWLAGWLLRDVSAHVYTILGADEEKSFINDCTYDTNLLKT